jgi:methylmalonyl-CoA mutase C-terminal domain/subunit
MHAPRIVVGLFGIDQHEVGAMAVCALLRDAGMEVVYAGRYHTPESLVRIALDEDADVVGVSCHSWEYLDYAPRLLALIAANALEVAVVLGGSVITAGDAATMRAAGVAAVFGPRDPPAAVVEAVREIAAARRRQKALPAGGAPARPFHNDRMP